MKIMVTGSAGFIACLIRVIRGVRDEEPRTPG